MHYLFASKKLIILLITVTLTSTMASAQSKGVKASSPSVYVKAGGGLAWRMGKIDDNGNSNIRNHLENLRSGTNLNAEAGVFIDREKRNAISLQYARFSSPAKSDYQEGNMRYEWDTREAISFTGANWVTFYPIGKKQQFGFISRLGGGILTYNNDTNLKTTIFFPGTPPVSGTPIKADIRESALGYTLGGGVDYRLSHKVALEINADFFGGSVTVEGEKENISNLGFTAGLRFSF